MIFDMCFEANDCYVKIYRIMLFRSRMKILVITNISILQFYKYIEYIIDISTDILKKI